MYVLSKERLTDKVRNFDNSARAKESLINEGGFPSRYTIKILNKLAEYEDLEEQGFLLRLPVAVGETVFTIERLETGAFYIKQAEVLMFEVFDTGLEARLKFSDKIEVYPINRIFITRNQAEERLANLK